METKTNNSTNETQKQENISASKTTLPFNNVNEFRAWLDNSDRKLTI